MKDRLQDLYDLPPKDLYLLDLVDQRACLEAQVLEIAEELPMEKKAILEAYIEVQNELEFQSVKRALKFGKHNYQEVRI